MLETKGHKASQPGLRGHSHDPEQDLMKRYVVARNMPTGGRLWLASFDTQKAANSWVTKQPTENGYALIDQFNDNEILWDEGGQLEPVSPTDLETRVIAYEKGFDAAMAADEDFDEPHPVWRGMPKTGIYNGDNE